MDNNPDTENYNSLIRKKLDGAQIAPSDELWSRIESSLDKQVAAPTITRRLTQWGGAIAASLLLLAASAAWFLVDSSDEETIQKMEELVARAEESIIVEPSPVEQPIEQPQEPLRLLSERTTKQSLVVQAKPQTEETTDIYTTTNEPSEPKPQKESNTKPKEREQTTQPTTNHDRSAPSKDLVLDRSVLRQSDRGDYNISLLLAEGVSSGSSSAQVASISPVLLASNGVAKLSALQGYNKSQFTHQQPHSFGVGVALPLNNRLSLSSGVNYTILDSEVSTSYIEKTIKQQLRFIGIPLKLDYTAYRSDNISLYASSGVMLERTLTAKLANERVDERNYHLSASIAVGAQYNINRWLGLYIEPDLSYYITPTRLTTIRTESPMQFTVRCGVRFTY